MSHAKFIRNTLKNMHAFIILNAHASTLFQDLNYEKFICAARNRRDEKNTE